MKLMLCTAMILFAARLPIGAHSQTPPSVAGDPSERGRAVVAALASMRGQFIGDGINTGFRPATPSDSVTLAGATQLADEELGPLLDCLADTSLSFIPYGDRPVSRGYVCYFAAIQTGWFSRNRHRIPRDRLIYASVSKWRIEADQHRRASALWQEFWLSSQRRAGEPP